MNVWHRYDSLLLPVVRERFEERWGKGTAPFLDPELHEQPMPRAQWVNPDSGAALAVVPVWAHDEIHRSFAVFYLPPTGDIWVLHPSLTDYVESPQEQLQALRNDAFRKAVAHATAFLGEPDP